MFKRAHIFLSHSQRDTALRDKFLATCGLAGITGVAFEFDIQSGRVPIDRAAADVIKEAIQSARALFVVIGPNVVATAHTSNWVSFEVGIAYASIPPVPVWVFEELPQYVDFPMPALNHHVLFDSASESEWDWIRSVMEGYAQKPLLGPRDPFADIAQVCAHPNCRAVFQTHYPGDVTIWKCPSCRQELHWVTPSTPGYHRSEPVE